MVDLALIAAILFLLGSLSLTSLAISLVELGRIQSKRQFYQKRKTHFFYFLLKRFFPKDEWDDLFFLMSATKQIVYLCYASFSLEFLLSLDFFNKAYGFDGSGKLILDIVWLLPLMLIIIAVPLILNFAIRPVARIWPVQTLKVNAFFGFFLLILFCPITFFLLKMQKLAFSKKKEEMKVSPSSKLKYKIMELLLESDISGQLDPKDQKLITSVISFRERVVKEVMIPRVDIVSLSIHQTIQEAAEKFIEEGYSRLPVYRDDIDHIVGVLLYKDFLACYVNPPSEKSQPTKTSIEMLIKPILYTPETKKISQLLQEFRNKQIHLAIVVDEYGGTEGIITIEDILEEIVGEIADEFDFDEEILYIPLANGGWIIDAKMNILDIEKKLGISIPASPEYETLGGYVYNCAGAIPSKGWKLHHDNFDLEVLSSNERGISKIRIIPSSSVESKD